MIVAKDSNGVYAAFDVEGMDGIIYTPPGVPYKGVTKPCSVLTVIYERKEKEFWGDLADNLYDTYLREYQLEQYATDNSEGYESDDMADGIAADESYYNIDC